MTVKPAATALGIKEGRLSDWIRKEKFHFEGVTYPYWDPGIPAELQGRRLFPRDWLIRMAAELHVEPDFSHIAEERATR